MIEMSQTGNNIGKYVQRERKKKGITQEQLAEYTGISWSAISRFETGQSMLSVERILKIAAVLDIGIESIVCDYVKTMPDLSDETTQEIFKLLSICGEHEKRYLLENLKLVMEHLHNA